VGFAVHCGRHHLKPVLRAGLALKRLGTHPTTSFFTALSNRQPVYTTQDPAPDGGGAYIPAQKQLYLIMEFTVNSPGRVVQYYKDPAVDGGGVR
jgi:hypothetical protein